MKNCDTCKKKSSKEDLYENPCSHTLCYSCLLSRINQQFASGYRGQSKFTCSAYTTDAQLPNG